ncbi:unnamed protein product [Cochlearia groenlandica]
MEELRRLGKFQSVVSAIASYGLLPSSYDAASSRFIANLAIFLVQPCEELDFDKKLGLVSDFIPKISIDLLEEISSSVHGEDEAKPVITSSGFFMNNVDPCVLRKHQDVVAMVGLDAMKRANSTLEDFSRSYFMFHGLEINEPQSIFRYLPVLSFTESYIYQLYGNHEISVQPNGFEMQYSSHGWNAESHVSFDLKPLGDMLELEGLLTERFLPWDKLSCLLFLSAKVQTMTLIDINYWMVRIQQEFKSGEEYWALERKLCHALSNKNKICLEDVMRAIHLKSFDYRVLNLLLYKLKGEEVNELHMDFLSISEFLVEVADDLFDYEDDVLENSFNVLRMFVCIFGPSNAPTQLAKRISEAEEKYEEIMKSLDPRLSSSYKRRCEEATKEGGKVSGHSLGTWNIPAVISDEEAYRNTQR